MSASTTAEIQALAAAPTQTDGPVPAKSRRPGGDYLTFCVGEVQYAMDILKVQELRSFETPTRIAGAPRCVLGVSNLRGTVVPILDLRQLLGSTEPQQDESTIVIVLALAHQVAGVVVDSVTDVVTLVGDQVRDAPTMRSGAMASHISGLYPLHGDGGSDQHMLVLLDIESLVADYVAANLLA